MKTQLRTGCVLSDYDRQADGFRVLVARFRGHGVKKSRYDAWIPSLGPSEKLLREVQSGKISWNEFERRFREELFESGPIDRKNRTIKNHGQKFTLRLLKALAERGPVTLLCHCHESQPRCHRNILKRIIEKI